MIFHEAFPHDEPLKNFKNWGTVLQFWEKWGAMVQEHMMFLQVEWTAWSSWVMVQRLEAAAGSDWVNAGRIWFAKENERKD